MNLNLQFYRIIIYCYVFLHLQAYHHLLKQGKDLLLCGDLG